MNAPSFDLYSGADNRFLLTEASATGWNWSRVASQLCQREELGPAGADGVLVLEPEKEAPWRMTIYNADGSRPEACGNGLRCAGWHLARREGNSRFSIQTDAGLRRVQVDRRDGRCAQLFASMGPAHFQELTRALPEVLGLRSAHKVSMGNPHCVLRVLDERGPDLESLGARMQSHGDFPNGVNVGLLARRNSKWHLRVWERGVGETAACGTGACAAVACILEQQPSLESTEISMAGGRLRVRPIAHEGQGDELELYGAAEHLASFPAVDWLTELSQVSPG